MMSSQRGNSQRTRSQKHKNVNAFKNSMHDTTNLTEMLNNLEIYGVCSRCKDQIDWRIRYKKYKPLAAPKKCVKCEQKTVKRAYTAACEPCGSELQICMKCLQPHKLIEKSTLTPEEENSRKQQLAAELRVLSERKRRAVERNLKEGKLPGDTVEADSANEDDAEDASEESSDRYECKSVENDKSMATTTSMSRPEDSDT